MMATSTWLKNTGRGGNMAAHKSGSALKHVLKMFNGKSFSSNLLIAILIILGLAYWK